MNKNKEDFETIKYNYVALKRIHLIANATNKTLNIQNTELREEVMMLKEQMAVIQKANLQKQETITVSYTRMNEMQNGYNQVIHDLHNKTQILEDKIKQLANGDFD